MLPVPAAHSAAIAEDGCKLTFLHDSQHFGFGELSLHECSPRLHIPRHIPRQTESNESLATLFLSGKMYEIVLDGTADGTIQSPILMILRILIRITYIANFAEKASATGQNLASKLHQLKDM